MIDLHDLTNGGIYIYTHTNTYTILTYDFIHQLVHHKTDPHCFSPDVVVQSEVHPNREFGLGLGHYPWMVYGSVVSLVHGGVPGMVDVG